MNSPQETFRIEPLSAAFRPWATLVLTEHWGSPRVVTRGRIHHADDLPGFIARRGGEPVGLITYRLEAAEGEIVTLNSLDEQVGIGKKLVETVVETARRAGCRRLWLITTNDNLPALRFYQKRGFVLRAVYPGALDASRKLKPEIPTVGIGGIPLRDEIELELVLRSSGDGGNS
ncbi:GNAT family N-acetyltransferase [bacterium]|nr:GNAT family N-acetyltransferase [bacterium]MBU1984136.1 GNAT family N-acetyltransferase [bacterium]